MNPQGINIVMNVGEQDAPILEHALKDIPINSCTCITRHEKYFPNLNAKKFIWYNPKALDEVDWSKIRPLDAKVIDSMRDAECVYMNMLNRAERKRSLPYQERKREYLQCLRYWNHVFEEGVDLFFSNEVPHFGFGYVPYMFCKKKNIPVLFFQNMRLVKDALFLSEDWENPVPDLPSIFEDLRNKYGDHPVELSKQFEEYFESQTNKEDPTPWHMKGKKAYVPKNDHAPLLSRLPRKIMPLIRDILLFIPRRLSIKYWRRHFITWDRLSRVRELFKFYDSHASTPDINKRFVYLALHMQPEATTCPMAGAYVDQFLMVQMLNDLLPDDILIYVKEHPDQGKRRCDLSCRNIPFYEDIVACKKVRLIPRTFSTFKLMENAEIVVTATGSPGFEALFRGTPVIMFGHRFFQHAPGVFHIHTVEDCRKALKSIYEDGVRPDLPSLRIFLKALEKVTIPGATNPDDMGASANSFEENVKIVGDALSERIREKLGEKIRSESAPQQATLQHVHRMQVKAL